VIRATAQALNVLGMLAARAGDAGAAETYLRTAWPKRGGGQKPLLARGLGASGGSGARGARGTAAPSAPLARPSRP